MALKQSPSTDNFSKMNELDESYRSHGSKGTSSGSDKSEKIELISVLLDDDFLSDDDVPQTIRGKHPTSGGTFMSLNATASGIQESSRPLSLFEDIDINMKFAATSVRESFTMQDVTEAFYQGTGIGFYNKDPDFVDFVLGGCIEDELDLYRKKNANKKKKRT
mmetsp:Transcript_27387/g.55156  ORF Transcript_27387/g.55156 Transcript_27387/m.55156 type:complete len:163 (-) Transcript_27387:5-493(-)